MLYNSNLILYDRQSKSLWAQLEGKAIVGDLALEGARLNMLPASVISWGDWKKMYPNGKVLSRDTGHVRPYGRNPYVGYDRVDQPPFLFRGKLDSRLLPMERVVTLSLGRTNKAYPFFLLSKRRVMEDKLEGQPVVIFYFPGTASAVDKESTAQSRDVGATGVFDPRLEGRALTFYFDGKSILDKETKSTWNVLGLAVSGPLQGKRLTQINHVDTFWFAWVAFKPDTLIAK